VILREGELPPGTLQREDFKVDFSAVVLLSPYLPAIGADSTAINTSKS